jgi:hypothetical protein
METALEVLVALARRKSFRDVAALAPLAVAGEQLGFEDAARVQRLCSFGQRLMDLDAEDFGLTYPAIEAVTDVPEPEHAGDDVVPPDLLARAAACRMPQAPGDPHRGALHSLHPVYRLMLELIRARWRRGEVLLLLAAMPVASEYAPLLSWEAALGHPADPQRIADDVTGRGSRWGRVEDRACRHTRAYKSAAGRVLRVADENPEGWTSYLDRQHSTVAAALAYCAVTCPTPCTVLTRLSTDERGQVQRRCRLAIVFAGSAVIRLRHSAPVGHGFGVPSRSELLEAWERSRRSIGQHLPAVLDDDDYPLAGLPALFSAIAGTPLAPDTLLADTAATVVAALLQPAPTYAG